MLTRAELTRLARIGAETCLAELREEEAAIRRTFPDITAAPLTTSSLVGRHVRRRRFTAAQRKATLERMKRYGATRRKNTCVT